jgi:hypothetical protein
MNELGDAHVPVERRILRHVTDAFSGSAPVVHDVDAGDPNDPRSRIEVAGDESQDGAFAGAIRSKQAEYLALLHLKGNGIDRHSGTKVLT